jgi:hypothetical protein
VRQGSGKTLSVGKNREYWRYELERESALNKPRGKQFV